MLFKLLLAAVLGCLLCFLLYRCPIVWSSRGNHISQKHATVFVFFKLLFAAVLVSFVSSDCLDCICQHESGCKAIGCAMDLGSLSCGYFQIKLPYYIDCGEPEKRDGETTESAWKRCSDNYQCAVSCVRSYLKRYRGLCADKGYGECQQLARLHNGGPYGCDHAQRTDGYWNAIHSCCNCS